MITLKTDLQIPEFLYRFGRKRTLILSVSIEVLTGLVIPFVPNYYAYLACRIVLGASLGATYTISFVIREYSFGVSIYIRLQTSDQARSQVDQAMTKT